ncbi:MAG: lysylphosphatidylglycerol synthase domain-containing protein, partial [Saprospiraceae bacterium]
FLLREKAIEQKTVVASALISRTLMVLTQLLLFILAGVVLIYNGWFSLRLSAIPPALYVVLPVIVLVIYFLVRNSWIKEALRPTAFGAALARRTAKLRQQAAELRLDLALFYKNNKKDLLLASVLFAIHWILGGMEFYFILRFLGLPATLTQGILVDMGVVFFKAAGAFVPGQIGIEEYGNKVMLAMVGMVGAHVWIAASILRRARQLFWIAFGLVVYFIMSKKWGTALRQP